MGRGVGGLVADTINLPGAGPVKKVYVYAGVAAAGGILAYAYYRRSKANAAAKADAAAAANSSATNDPNAIDPSTGLPYSQESSAGQVGYGQPGYGGYGGYPQGNGQYCPYGYDAFGNCLQAPTNAGGSGGAYTNNNDWATAAETALTNTGMTLSVAATAISRVLAGLSVTSDQQGIFLQAIGLVGQPPQGYPKPIHVVDTPGHPGGGGGHNAPPPAPGNVHATAVTRDSVTIAWDAVNGADHYTLYKDGHKVTDTKGTTATAHGLAHGHRYLFTVNAWNSAGRGPSGSVYTATHH